MSFNWVKLFIKINISYFPDGYKKASCNDELYLVKGGPASGSIILTIYKYIVIIF